MNSNIEFNPCAVVPVYNHGKTAMAVVQDLVSKNLPVVLVDDGSSDETKQQLLMIEKQIKECHLFVLDKNQGKGGAVMHGLKEAYKMGFTHALQVDADGQHDLENISLFIDKAYQNPEYLIGSFPVYDDSVPKSRKIGRIITNSCVAFETLSKDIPDAMCGFRVYPLNETYRLITTSRLGRRMEFDIEILVKLHWMGVKMMFFPVRVIYPENGISNFRMFYDNAAISGVHTFLIIGMILRLPILITRKFIGLAACRTKCF